MTDATLTSNELSPEQLAKIRRQYVDANNALDSTVCDLAPIAIAQDVVVLCDEILRQQTELRRARSALVRHGVEEMIPGNHPSNTPETEAFTKASCRIVEKFNDGDLALTIKVAPDFRAERGTELEIRHALKADDQHEATK